MICLYPDFDDDVVRVWRHVNLESTDYLEVEFFVQIEAALRS